MRILCLCKFSVPLTPSRRRVDIGCTAEDVCAHFKALAKLQVDIPESA